MSRVERASPGDLAGIRNLLEASSLPTSDLAAASPHFVVIRDAKRIVAAGALEHFGSAALLRSVVVAADQRGRGLGHRVTQELEREALSSGISELILLTESAADFFALEGYRVIERAAAPPAVQQSAEFRSLCPSSAVCMAKTLSALGSR